MNAYIIEDFYSDLPYTPFYLFAESLQDAFSKINRKNDLVSIKEIPLFQDPETLETTKLGVYYFEVIPSIEFKIPQRTIGVLAESVEIAFSIITECLDEDSKVVEFLLGEGRFSPYPSF